MPDEHSRISVDDELAAVRPALALVLGQLAIRMNRDQDRMPQWLRQLLEDYGRECVRRGVRLAHDVDTMPAPSRDSDGRELFDDGEQTPAVDVWKR